MTDQTPNLPLDSEGIPILTDPVSTEELLSAGTTTEHFGRYNSMSTAEISEELLSSELFQRQLDEVAAELSRNIRLQTEQALGTAIEDIISKTLDRNNARSFELIRVQLEDALPELLAKVLQDQDVTA
jgi:hypothetical protein